MWQLIRKDLYLIVRDRLALVILLCLPVVLIAILGVSTGRIETGESSGGKIQLLVVDQGRTEAAAELTEGLRRHPLVMVDDRDDARARPGAQWRGRVVLGADFERRVESTTLQELMCPRQGWPGDDLAGLDVRVEGLSDDVVGQRIVEELVLVEAGYLALNRLARRDPDLLRLLTTVRSRVLWQQPISLSSIYEVAHEGSGVYQVLVPSYAVLFVFFLINFISRSLVVERSLGTLCRLRVSPLHPLAIMAGKTTPFFLVSLAQSALLLLGGKILFQMWWGGAPWMLIPVAICTSLAATTLGLAAATFAHTETQVTAFDTLLVITLGAISGCLMPREWLPDLLRQVSLATPHAWALIAYDQLLVQPLPDVARVWRCCLALVGFSAVFAAIGWRRFGRWSRDPR